MGVGRAVRFLQGAVGCGVDGQFGPGTARAVAGCEPRSALAAYCDAREAFYRRFVVANPKLKVFLKGWLNRLNSLRKEVGLPVFGFTGTGIMQAEFDDEHGFVSDFSFGIYVGYGLLRPRISNCCNEFQIRNFQVLTDP